MVPQQPHADLFRLAFDLSPSGMLAVDGDGRIRLANAEVQRLFGYTLDELIGEPIEKLVPGRFRAHHPAHRGGYAAQAQTRPMGEGRDLYGLHRDGTEFPVEIGLNPVSGPGGLIVLASVVDISGRRRIEERVRHSQKMEAIGTLAGGIAHDFNNVLLGIIGYTELVTDSPNLPDSLHDDLAQVLKAADRGRLLVQRILSFSRPNEAPRVPLRLDRSVREVLHLLRATLPTTIQMHDALDPATPEVLSDETSIHQVLMNLATNAAHAMPEGGKLEVRLSLAMVDEALAASRPTLRPGRYARLTVKDSGQGMPPEVLRRAFEPFFTTKPAGRGTGLGLSVIHGIVQAHGGFVDVQSEPGRGTRMDVYLPAHVEGPLEPMPLPAEAAPASSRHVLLVDDEADLLSMLRRQLESLGLRVTARSSAVEAWEDFQASPESFDLVITDNTMPLLTGLELSMRVRSARADVPVLLISGLAQTADPEMLRAHGVTRTLRKPHTRAELTKTLDEIFGA